MGIRGLILLFLALSSGAFFLNFSQAYAQSSSAHSDLPPPQCQRMALDEPPVFVIPTGYDSDNDKDAMERKRDQGGYKNYYPAKDSERANTKVIAKRTVVKVDKRYNDFIKQKSDVWIPATVLSVPNENKMVQRTSIKGQKAVGAPQDGRDFMEVGETGFVNINDLEMKEQRQDDFVFMVIRDSPVYKMLYNDKNNDANLLKRLEPLAMKLKRTSDGRYEVNYCCGIDKNNNKVCDSYPVFRLLNTNYEVASNCFGCTGDENKTQCFDAMKSFEPPVEEKFLNPLRAITSRVRAQEEGKTLTSIRQFNFVDSRGFVQIPMTDIAGDNRVRMGPFNSLHYGSEQNNADVYMKPDVACGFMQALKAWNATCKGQSSCQIEFGDASHAFYKGCTRGSNRKCANPWPHQSHTDGECVDVNVSRMGSKGEVQKMLKIFDQVGPSTIGAKCLSGHPSLKGICAYEEGHPTHMHICFPTNLKGKKGQPVVNQKLQDACYKGVNP